MKVLNTISNRWMCWVKIAFNCVKIGSRQMGYYEHLKGPACSTGTWEFPDKMGEYQLLKPRSSSACRRHSTLPQPPASPYISSLLLSLL